MSPSDITLLASLASDSFRDFLSLAGEVAQGSDIDREGFERSFRELSESLEGLNRGVVDSNQFFIGGERERT